MPLADYTRIRKLGKGSFGEVYLVRDRRDGAQYVLKEVDVTTLGPKGRREALREAALLSQCNHTCIVKYREFFEQDPGGLGRKMLYIIMEYADGGDLDGRIKAQNGRLFPESTILEWFVQICLAVKHIHDRKIIHRDLKAENIFLLRPSSSSPSSLPICKLGDFGISKSMAHTMANAITRIGTPYYLSPEICMNKPYNMKSDMWALGVVLYELMSLKHPFDATSMEGLLQKIVKTNPPPLSRNYSIELRTIVDSLLSKTPAKRPTVNALIKLPFLQPYVSKVLTPEMIEDEFSHTVIHSNHPGRPAPGRQREQYQLPPPNQIGKQVKQQQPLPSTKQRQTAAAAAQQPHMRPQGAYPPRSARSVYRDGEQKEAFDQPPPPPRHNARSPYVNGQDYNLPPQHYPPTSARQPQQHQQQYNGYPPNSARHPSPSPYAPSPYDMPPSARGHPSSVSVSASGAGAAATPSPYAGMSHAEKLKAIRARKDAELAQARMQAMQQQDEAERMQRQREMEKERALAAQAAGAAPRAAAHPSGLPPVMRPRGIAPVSRRATDAPPPVGASSAMAAPLHGAPYSDRTPTGAGAASRMHQLNQYQLAEQARRQREEEITRMRMRYFQERKSKREGKLRDVQATNSHANGNGNGYGYGPGGIPRAGGGSGSAYSSRPPSGQVSQQRYGQHGRVPSVGAGSGVHSRRPSGHGGMLAPVNAVPRWR